MKELENGRMGRNQRSNLRRYKYLRLEASSVRTSHLQFVFMGFAVFSIGILIGFNFKDVLKMNCFLKRAVSNPTSETRMAEAANSRTDFKDQVKPKSHNKTAFTTLPRKYLNNIPMPPPARFYHLRPWKIIEEVNKRNGSEKHLLMVLVKTASAFLKRRFQIRLTWGSMAEIERRKIAVMFTVGVSRNRAQQKLLEEENDLYGDIIQGDVSDVYRELPTKVLSGYQFVVEYLGNVSEYFVSTDDDCFLNIVEIYQYTRQLDSGRRDAAHCGYVYSAKAFRITKQKSKWAVADNIYPISAYPRFCHGGMTLLSYNMIHGIYRIALVTNYTGFHLEDVLTNGILREKLPNRKNNIMPIYLRDPNTQKRLPMVWHLGYRRDKDEAFLGIWRGIKRRFSYYEGPFDRAKGFRVTINPMRTLEGKSIRDTIIHFYPLEANKPVNRANVAIKHLPSAKQEIDVDLGHDIQRSI